MQPGCVGLQVMVRVAAASRAYGRSLRLRASSQAHYGVDEDEEWWPGRVLGVHSQGAHTVASTTTASSSSDPTWFKVRQRPVFWPSGRVPSTLRARQCSPTTAPSGAGSGVPFFPGGGALAAVAPLKGRQLGAKCRHEGRRCVSTPSFSRTRPPKGDLCGTWSVHA